MAQDLLFMIDNNKYFQQFKYFAFCKDIQIMPRKHIYQYLHRRDIFPPNLMTSILQNQQQFLTILEQIIKTLNNTTNRDQTLIKQWHFLHKNPRTCGVPRTNAHNTHHGINYDNLLISVITLLELFYLLFSGYLFDECTAHTDQGVYYAYVSQQFLVV